MAGILADRRIEPELLDILPAKERSAVESRRDLAWINALLLQSWIVARLLRRHVSRPPRRILEIGSGDGTFMLSVARRVCRDWIDVDLAMLDQTDVVDDDSRAAFATLGWRVETVTHDIFEWMGKRDASAFDVITANLVLHHFTSPELARLFAALPRMTPLFLATEPRRNAVSLAGCWSLRAIGVNHVTRHDSVASVRAGFKGDELTALWPSGSAHRLSEHAFGPFTHTFVADAGAGEGQ